jgi:hypothetical protein
VALSKNKSDREYSKFVECQNETAVRSKICQEDGESIKVELVEDGFTGETTNIFNKVSSVPASALTTVLTYTVPVASTFRLEEVSCSGENYAEYRVFKNGGQLDEGRTFWCDFNVTFNFKKLKLETGDILEVKVIHERPSLSTHSAKAIGKLE